MPRSSWHISFPRKDVVPLVTTTVHVPSSSSSTQTDTIAVLLGFYSELEAAKHLIHLNVVDGPTTLAEIHSIWEQTSKQVARAQRRSYSQPHIDSLPAQWQYYEQNLKKQPKFQCCLPRREYHIRKVPIQSLITPQWFVNRDHVEHCKQQAPEPEPSDWDSILNFIFPAESPLPSPKQNQASLLFPPDIQNLHITLSPVQRGAVQEYVSTLRVHAAPNYLQVAKIGGRLVLVNGVHRTCALWQRGWKKIPCLLFEAQNLLEAGFPPGQLGVLPEQTILHRACPPYALDLLDDTLTRSFQQHRTTNMQVCVQRMPVVVNP